MAEELEELCGRISLSDSKLERIAIIEGEIAVLKEKESRCLVGRLLTKKRTNKEAFRTLLIRLWRVVGRVIFQEVQDHLWIFEFSDCEDQRRVLEGRPWSFHRHLLVLNEFDGRLAPSQLEFQFSPFWVQVHDLPLLCMTVGVRKKIGLSLEKFVSADVAGDGGGWGRSLRIHVILDLTKPLERGRAILVEGRTCWVTFQYEKLPMFCFWCGRIIHDQTGCPERLSQFGSAAGGAARWGSWLRAGVPQKKFSGELRAESSKWPVYSAPLSTAAEEEGGAKPANINSGTERSQALHHDYDKSRIFGNPVSAQIPCSVSQCIFQDPHNHDSSITEGIDFEKRQVFTAPIQESNVTGRDPTFVFKAANNVDGYSFLTSSNNDTAHGPSPSHLASSVGLGGPSSNSYLRLSEIYNLPPHGPASAGFRQGPFSQVPVISTQKGPSPSSFSGDEMGSRLSKVPVPPLQEGCHQSVTSWKCSARARGSSPRNVAVTRMSQCKRSHFPEVNLEDDVNISKKCRQVVNDEISSHPFKAVAAGQPRQDQ